MFAMTVSNFPTKNNEFYLHQVRRRRMRNAVARPHRLLSDMCHQTGLAPHIPQPFEAVPPLWPMGCSVEAGEAECGMDAPNRAVAMQNPAALAWNSRWSRAPAAFQQLPPKQTHPIQRCHHHATNHVVGFPAIHALSYGNVTYHVPKSPKFPYSCRAAAEMVVVVVVHLLLVGMRQ